MMARSHSLAHCIMHEHKPCQGFAGRTIVHVFVQVEVYDNWAGGPGAAVIAAGKSSTRENRLVAWAEDIERLVASQV